MPTRVAGTPVSRRRRRALRRCGIDGINVDSDGDSFSGGGICGSRNDDGALMSAGNSFALPTDDWDDEDGWLRQNVDNSLTDPYLYPKEDRILLRRRERSEFERLHREQEDRDLKHGNQRRDARRPFSSECRDDNQIMRFHAGLPGECSVEAAKVGHRLPQQQQQEEAFPSSHILLPALAPLDKRERDRMYPSFAVWQPSSPLRTSTKCEVWPDIQSKVEEAPLYPGPTAGPSGDHGQNKNHKTASSEDFAWRLSAEGSVLFPSCSIFSPMRGLSVQSSSSDEHGSFADSAGEGELNLRLSDQENNFDTPNCSPNRALMKEQRPLPEHHGETPRHDDTSKVELGQGEAPYSGHGSWENVVCPRTADALMEMGKERLVSHEYSVAERIFEAAHQIYAACGKPLAVAHALDRMAWACGRTASKGPASHAKGGGTRDGDAADGNIPGDAAAEAAASKALSALQDALFIRYHELGPWHIDTVDTLNRTGALYMHLNRLRDARSCYWQVFWVRKAIFGPEHPAVAVAAHDLAGCFLKLGSLKDADNFYQIGLEIYDKMNLSEKNPAMAKLRRDMKRLRRIELCRGTLDL